MDLFLLLSSFFIFSPTDSSLTLANLTQLLQDVRHWDLLSVYLNIPNSVHKNIISQHSSESERREAYCKWYLNNHPCPSWYQVARAVYMFADHGVLEVLQSRYHKGEPCFQ